MTSTLLPLTIVPAGVSVFPVPAAAVSYVWLQVAMSPLARLPAVSSGRTAEEVVPSAVLVAVCAVTVMARVATVKVRSTLAAGA